MKKYFTAFSILLLLAVNAWAQTEPAPRITYDTIPAPPDTLAINAARKGHFVFFDFGGGLNNVSFKVEDTCAKKSPGFGISARFGYRYFFSPNWGIGVGLNYSTYQGITTINFVNKTANELDTSATFINQNGLPRDYSSAFKDLKERITVSAIEIPVGLYYQHALGSRFRLGAGVNVSMTQILTKKFKSVSGALANTATYSDYNLKIDSLAAYGLTTYTTLKGTPALKTTIIGLGGELSLHYALTSKLDITLNLSGTYRLGNIKKRDDGKLWNSLDTGYTSTAYVGITQTQLAKNVNLVNVGATIGLRYRLAKKPQPQIIERVLPPIDTLVVDVDTTDNWYNRDADDFGVNILPMGYTFVNSGLDMTKQLERKKVGDPIGVPIHFALNSDQLADTSHTLMDTVVTFLKKNPDVIKMEVSAHTDNIGSDAYNLDLSKRRALTVVNYLISQGVEPERLEPVGYGESRPLNDNSTEAMRDINRRVEFVIMALDDSKIPLPDTPDNN